MQGLGYRDKNKSISIRKKKSYSSRVDLVLVPGSNIFLRLFIKISSFSISSRPGANRLWATSASALYSGDLPGRLTPWSNHNNCSLLRGLGCTCHFLCRVFRAYADSVGIIRNVLGGIFSEGVCNYAATGSAGKLFNEDLIRNAFNEKRDTI